VLSASFREIVKQVGEGPCKGIVSGLEPTVLEWIRASEREHLFRGSKGFLAFEKVTLPFSCLARERM